MYMLNFYELKFSQSLGSDIQVILIFALATFVVKVWVVTYISYLNLVFFGYFCGQSLCSDIYKLS